jgi:hypothetical protein
VFGMESQWGCPCDATLHSLLLLSTHAHSTKQSTFVTCRLYHMRRGPLAGLLSQHADEREVSRALALRVDAAHLGLLVRPQVYAFGAGFNPATGAGVRVPTQTLAMRSQWVLVVDHLSDVFLWTGQLAPTASCAAASRFAERLTADPRRLPAPLLQRTGQGGSDARHVLARLAPAHKDSAAVRRADFPDLATLTQAQCAALLSGLPPVDEPGFGSFLVDLIANTTPAKR